MVLSSDYSEKTKRAMMMLNEKELPFELIVVCRLTLDPKKY